MAPTSRNARIDLRLTAELKQFFESAAASLGQSLSEFVVSTVRERAFEVQEQNERTVLSRRDRDLLLAALDESEPSQALIRSAELYKLALRKQPDVDDRSTGSPPR